MKLQLDTRKYRQRLTTGEWRWWAVLVLLGLLLSPLLVTRDFAPGDELKVLCLTDEALGSGIMFAFTYHGVPCAGWITPLYMWIVMGCKLLFGSHVMFAVGLFSLIPALLIIRILDLWVTQEMHREREEWNDLHRISAILMLATTTYYLVGACMVRMGVLMCLFLTLALRQIWYITDGDKSPRRQWLLGFFTLLAFLTKGFVSILVPILTPIVLAVLARRFSVFGRCWNWRACLILVVGITLWLVAVRLEGGSAYFETMLSRWYPLPLITDDFAVAWFYIKTLFGVLLPWTLVVLLVLWMVMTRRITQSSLQRYFLVIVLVVLIILSCQSARIGIFLLPLLPFLIYYSAISLPALNWSYAKSLAVGIPALVLTSSPIILLAAGGAFAPIDEIVFRGSWLLRPFFFLAAFVITGFSVLSLVRNYRDHDLSAAIRPLAIGIVLNLFVASFGIDQDANSHFGYRELCTRIEKLSKTSPKEHPEVYTWQLNNAENLHVYLHRKTHEVTTSEVVMGRHHGDIVVVSLTQLRQDPRMHDYFRNQHATFCGAYALLVAE